MGIREIAVISGKGGAGKTTVTASFALLSGKKVVVDADVDAPDLHIVLKPEVIEAYVFKGHKVAKIDKELCDGCGLCRKLCRFDAIGEDFSVDEVMCEGCALCYFACPQNAVTMEERESGIWFVAKSRAGIMVHAKLHPGEENSGKLVTQIRRRAKEIAQEEDIPLILIDGPPGIGCPVISSITGVTDVVLVAEPTLSGFHDLKRVVELAKAFNPRLWLIINKFDISVEKSQEIESWASSSGIRLLGRLSTDPEIPALQAQCKAPVEGDTLSGEMLKEMWEKLTEEV